MDARHLTSFVAIPTLLHHMPSYPAMSKAHLFKKTTPIKVLMKDTDIMRTVYLNSKRLKISGNSIQGDRNLEDKMEMLLLLK